MTEGTPAKLPKPQKTKISVFTSKQHAEWFDDEGNAMLGPFINEKNDLIKPNKRLHAYAIEDIGAYNTKYYIKYSIRNEIFEPQKQEHQITLNRKENNIDYWNWRKVSVTTFKHYLNFIRTNNQAELSLARRAMVT